MTQDETTQTAMSLAGAMPAPVSLSDSPWKFCPSCGRQLQSGWRHCASCGRYVMCGYPDYPMWIIPGVYYQPPYYTPPYTITYTTLPYVSGESVIIG